MRIAVLCGGVGGARFLRGLREHLCAVGGSGDGGSHEITAIVNVGDDMWLTGLRITPDLDSIMYTLAGANDDIRGWGRRDESERVAGELAAYGAGWEWFTLGDLDLGTHIARSGLLREGLPLSAATDRITARWPLGVRLIPATDDEVETQVHVADRTMHLQEWWTRYRASIPALSFEYRNAPASSPAPGVLEAIASADVIVLAPSNPVVSIAPILAIPGIREAVLASPAPVIGVSPIIAGAVVRGMADACLSAIGVATTADAVALHYRARSAGGILDAWLVDEADAALLPAIEAGGITASAVPLRMSDLGLSAALARDVLAVAARL